MKDAGLLVLRVFPGLFMFFAHGLPKLMSYSERADSFPDPLGVGSSASLLLTIFAEVVCAALITVGLFTRYSALVLFICMIVAGLVVHGPDPFSRKELALLFAVCYLANALLGAGKWSLDWVLRKKT